jgi:hypothetical protein
MNRAIGQHSVEGGFWEGRLRLRESNERHRNVYEAMCNSISSHLRKRRDMFMKRGMMGKWSSFRHTHGDDC